MHTGIGRNLWPSFVIYHTFCGNLSYIVFKRYFLHIQINIYVQIYIIYMNSCTYMQMFPLQARNLRAFPKFYLSLRIYTQFIRKLIKISKMHAKSTHFLPSLLLLPPSKSLPSPACYGLPTSLPAILHPAGKVSFWKHKSLQFNFLGGASKTLPELPLHSVRWLLSSSLYSHISPPSLFTKAQPLCSQINQVLPAPGLLY